MPSYLYVCSMGHVSTLVMGMTERHPRIRKCPECRRPATRDRGLVLEGKERKQSPFRPFLLHAAGKVIESADQIKKVDAEMEKKGFVNVGRYMDED